MARGQALEPPASDLTLRIPTTPGTYALGLRVPPSPSHTPLRITVGASGTWDVPAGLYLYVGSAWGSGGLRARLGRHLTGSAALRWHIDYLRQDARPVAVWLAPGTHLECTWAQALAEDPAAEILIPRFGASDCRCPAHLFHLGDRSPEDVHLPGDPEYLCRLGDSASR